MKKKYPVKMISILAAVILILLAVPAVMHAGEPSDSLAAPEGFVAALAVKKISPSDDVLILKDTDAWASPANEQILKDMGISFSVAGSLNYGEFDLNNYEVVIVVSDQPQAFYNAFNDHLAEFENYIRSGGVLIFNGADKGWNQGFWAELPGGLHHKKIYDNTNFISDSAHPISQGMPASFWGNYASHDYFEDIPAGAKLISRNSGSGYTTVEYKMDAGTVIASCITLEAHYGWGWPASTMLVSTIKYALSLQGVTPSEPPLIRAEPENMEKVSLPDPGTDMKVLKIHNDGEMSLSFHLRIQDMNPVNNAMAQLAVNNVPAGVAGSNAKPQNYAAESVNVQINAEDKVLLLKDVNPWASTANEDILKKLEVAYSVAGSANMASLTLGIYQVIIVASDQPQAFYDAFQANFSKFEAYVTGGGVLMFNGADKGWQNGFWAQLPGGVTHEIKYDGANYVADPDHPAVEGVANHFIGNAASHDHFMTDTIPDNAKLITKDSSGAFTGIEYSLGSGRVIASGITLEASYAWGWEGGKILVNLIRHALKDLPPPLAWLSADIYSGTVEPEQYKEVKLSYNSAGLKTGVYNAAAVIMSNDPVNPSIKVGAELEVIGDNCPKADNQTVETCQDTAKSITLTATPAGGTYSIVKQPEHGTLSGNAPNVSYQPEEGYSGSDTFTFKVNNGVCDSNTATVTVEVKAANLKAEPGAFSKTMDKVQQPVTETLVLKNEGCGNLNYEVSITEKKSPEIKNLVGGLQAPPAIRNIPVGVQYVPGEMIVRLAPNANPNAVNLLANNVGAMVQERIPALNMEVWQVPNNGVQDIQAQEVMINAISILSNDPNVVYAEPNYILKAFQTPDDPKFGELWGLHNEGCPECNYDQSKNGVPDADIDALEAWDIFRGSTDVVVAVIDTGIDYNHEDLKANMWMNEDETPGNGKDDDNNGFVDDVYGYDFVNNDSDPMDGNRHGTHCAGTIGGAGDNAKGVIGVSPVVRLMALKFLADNGSGSTSDAIKAIMYAVDNGAHILSNSWGGGGESAALKEAIAYANDRDRLFVAASGNRGENIDILPSYPAAYDVPNVFAVGATDCLDELVFFSNYGVKNVDIGAPGTRILSSIPNNTYEELNGTSMATPHVSGAAALLKGYKPALTAVEIKDMLMNTADPLASLQGKCVSGARLNVHEALKAADKAEWLELNGTLSGTIPAGSSVNLSLVLNAMNKAAGDYSANITITLSDDPNNPSKVVVPVTLTVNGGQNQLAINRQGNGVGKVKVEGEEYSLPWQSMFSEGKQVHLEAIAEGTSRFVGWSNGEKKPAIYVTMQENKTLTAEFSADPFYTLEIQKSGEGQVKVNDAVQNLPWSEDFKQGTSVTVEAVPGAEFKEWYGDVSADDTKSNPVTIIMDAKKVIQPVFTFKEKWQAEIQAEGEKVNGQGVAYDEWMLNANKNILVHKTKVTIGVNSYSETLDAPPLPPEYSVNMVIHSNDWKKKMLKDIRVQGENQYSWILAVNPSGNAMPPKERTAVLSWNPKRFNPSGTYKLLKGYDVNNGEVLVADMRTTTEYAVTGGNSDQFFTIVKSEGAYEMGLKAGWNMVSLPILPDDPSPEAVFPNATAIWKFNPEAGYEEPGDAIEANVGYWVKVPNEEVLAVKGQNAIRGLNLPLGCGWHLIGAPYGNVRPEPFECIEVMYDFDEMYEQAFQLNAGKAVWVKISEDCCNNGKAVEVHADTQ